MQTEGILSKWNDEKGCGVITPQRGGPDIFVDIAAFPQEGQRPQLHEKLFFTVQTDKNGRKRATRIERPGQKKISSQPEARPHKRTSTLSLLAMSALLVATLAYGYLGLYGQDQDPGQSAPTAQQSSAPLSTSAQPATFHCDGRTHCDQMTSCAEAEYFLHHCPNVQLDGNGDGVPCERQWCGR
jgi:cold shock CspA family protein